MQIGIGHSQTIEVPGLAGMETWEFCPDRGQAIIDVAQAAARAVTVPEDFPPLAEAIVEGDQIVLALDVNCPEIVPLLLGLVRAVPLDKLGSLTILLSSEATSQTEREITEALAPYPQCEIVLHQPEDRTQLGYLAASAAADPIYLNRRLIDADLVIPVFTARPFGSLDPAVMEGGIFPAFADLESQKRVRQETLAGAGVDDQEAREVAWLLGVQFLVSVIPTADARVARVIAGSPPGIRRAVEHQIEATWQRDISRKADLVFACLDGNQQQQTWDNVARALHVARHLVRPRGSVVITSRLESPVGAALHRLAANVDFERLQAQLAKDKHRDALAASLILEIRQEGRLLMLSRLPAEEVEGLGIGAIEHPSELLRLIPGHRSCAIIRAAQFCGIGVPR